MYIAVASPYPWDQGVTQLIEPVTWKLMEFDEPCLEWVPYLPESTISEYPVLSRKFPASNQDSLIARTREREEKYSRPYRNRPRAVHTLEIGLGLVHTLTERIAWRVRMLVHPNGITGDRQMIPKEGGHAWHNKAIINIELIRTHQFFPTRYKLSIIILYNHKQ